jgi:hypothetical protein
MVEKWLKKCGEMIKDAEEKEEKEGKKDDDKKNDDKKTDDSESDKKKEEDKKPLSPQQLRDLANAQDNSGMTALHHAFTSLPQGSFIPQNEEEEKVWAQHQGLRIESVRREGLGTVSGTEEWIGERTKKGFGNIIIMLFSHVTRVDTSMISYTTYN